MGFKVGRGPEREEKGGHVMMTSGMEIWNAIVIASHRALLVVCWMSSGHSNKVGASRNIGFGCTSHTHEITHFTDH